MAKPPVPILPLPDEAPGWFRKLWWNILLDWQYVNFLGTAGSASPLTTKGDIWGYSTTNARIPVGPNGDVLTADSTQALGVKWAAGGGGGTVTHTAGALTAGQLVIGNGGADITVGDLSGDATTSGSTAVTVGKINGVSISGTPAAGYAPVATSSSAATWGPQVGGGMTKIGKVVTSGSATTITFSSIPATYSDLMLTFSGRETGTGATAHNVYMEFNGDTTAADYQATGSLFGRLTNNSGYGTVSSTTTGGYFCSVVGTGSTSGANAVTVATLSLPNYAGTVFRKAWTVMETQYLDASEGFGVYLQGGEWLSASAVSSIVLTIVSGSTFLDGTTATLYGLG